MADDRNRNHWNRLGTRYSEGWAAPAQRRLSEKETSFVLEHLPPEPSLRVLDVGIGNGRIIEKLLAAERVACVYGIDIAPKMVEICENRFGGDAKLKSLLVCDVATEELRVPAGLQFISAIRVLKYNRDWWGIVERKLLPHLAPGGVLVFSMPNAISTRRFSRPYAVDSFSTTEKELRDRLNRSGSTVLAISGFSKFPDTAYRAFRRPVLAQSLLAVEQGLNEVLGSTRLARELFVAVRRAI